MDTAYRLIREAGLVDPEMKELDNAFLVVVRHKRIASLQELALEFLVENGEIQNRDLREISGEDSENKVKKALQKLREDDLIELVDQGVSRFKYKYKLTDKGRQYIKQSAT